MKFWCLFFSASLILPNYCNAVVKRRDIPQEKYLVENVPNFLIDILHEGHCVLIAPQWIVTAAHVIFYDYTGKSIKIGGESYKIESVTKHLDYIEPDESLLKCSGTFRDSSGTINLQSMLRNGGNQVLN